MSMSGTQNIRKQKYGNYKLEKKKQHRTPGSKVADLYAIYFLSFCRFITHFTPPTFPSSPPLHCLLSTFFSSRAVITPSPSAPCCSAPLCCIQGSRVHGRGVKQILWKWNKYGYCSWMAACHITIVYSYAVIGLKCIIIESRNNVCPLLIVKDWELLGRAVKLLQFRWVRCGLRFNMSSVYHQRALII